MAISCLTMAFQDDALLNILEQSETADWPSGLAYVVVDELFKIYKPVDIISRVASPSEFTLTWWGGLLNRTMETKNSQHPTCTPRPAHPNLNTLTCKRNLNTAPTCATSITNTNSDPHSSHTTSSIPYIIPTPTSISSSTPSTLAPTSPPPSTPAPPRIYHIMSIFLLRQGEFL
jgi:hypothetical protein